MRGPLSLAFALAISTGAAAADAVRLDDSLSPQQRVQSTTRWAYDSSAPLDSERINALVSEVRGMEFRLKTAPYVGKQARIYLKLPLVVRGLRTPGAMRLDWTTRGKLAPGSVIPGDRALVFQGKIQEPLLTEFFDFRIRLDARQVQRGLEFEPIFEIELADR
jgi:hypothetical protein